VAAEGIAMVWGSVPGSTVGVGVAVRVDLGFDVWFVMVGRDVVDGSARGASDELLQAAASTPNVATASVIPDVRRGFTDGSVRALVYWEAN